MTTGAANPVLPFLEHGSVLVLDGGLATELEARGCDLRDDLWSAGVLIDTPERIREVHRDYLTAGADCIISASYQASLPGFRRRGLRETQATDLLRLSVRLACEARDAFWSRTENRVGRQRPLVAASVGPYGAYLADGAEYRGDYGVDAATLADFHRRRFGILAGGGADLLAFESIPSRDEALVLRQLLRETPGSFAWFSFTCRDGRHLSDGTPLVEMLRQIDDEEHVVALGINCTAPRFIPSLISEARRATARPIVVYPNSGETYDAATKRWTGSRSPEAFADGARRWWDGGARLLGGCCRTGPDHIRQIRAQCVGS